MNTHKIHARVFQDLREAGYKLNELESMSAKELFSAWCEWHGLINWRDTLWHVVLSLKEAEKCHKDTRLK